MKTSKQNTLIVGKKNTLRHPDINNQRNKTRNSSPNRKTINETDSLVQVVPQVVEVRQEIEVSLD